MANKHPKFGDIGGVPFLDFGQADGDRSDTGFARFSGSMIAAGEEMRTVMHELPQQHIVFRDVLGYAAGTVTLSGTIRAKNDVTMNAIIAEINQRMHGMLRDPATGVMGAHNPVMVRETELTSVTGDRMWKRVVLDDWRQHGRRLKSQEWGAITQCTFTFKVLG